MNGPATQTRAARPHPTPVRVWWIALAAFLLLAGASWVAFIRSERNQAIALAEARGQVIASLVAAHAERSLQVADEVLRRVEALVTERKLNSRPPMSNEWAEVRTMIAADAEIGSVWVLDAAGNAVLDSANFPSRLGNFADREYFIAHRDGARGLILSPARAGIFSGRSRFTASQALVGEGGEFIGVAVVAIYSDYFAEVYREASKWPGMSVGLRLAADGRPLAGWPVEAPPPDAVARNALIALAGGDRRGVAQTSEGDKTWIVAWSALAEQPALAVARQTLDGALAGWRTTMLQTGIWVLAACIGFTFLVGLGARGAGAVDRKVEERTARLAEALARNNMLMSEAHHRIKNNLQFIGALIAGQARSTDRAGREQLKDLERRIHAIGRLHERIYRTGDFETLDVAALLGPLCADVARSAGAEGVVSYECSGAIPLKVDRALPLTLVVNELLTNAIKHGARNAPRVVVRCATDESELIVDVRDNGPGLPGDFDLAAASNFGLKMARLLARQEGGQLSARLEGGMTVFELRVPLEDTQDTPPRQEPDDSVFAAAG